MSRRVLDALGISELAEFAPQPALRLTIVDRDLNSRISLPLGKHVMVDREAFDTGLRARVAARNHMGFVDETHVLDWTQLANEFRVEISHRGVVRTVTAGILVDASGAAGAAKREAGRALPTATALQLWYSPQGDPTRCDWIFDAGDTPYYEWAIHKRAGLLIGGVFPRQAARRGRIALTRIAQSLKLRGAPWRVQAAPMVMPQEPCQTRLERRGALVVGEAAGLINAGTGEGISFALRSGLLCGRAIAASQTRSEAARLYERAVSPLIAEVGVKARHARHMFQPAWRRGIPADRLLIPVPRLPLELPA